MQYSSSNSADVHRAVAGDRTALARVFEMHRPRLRRMVAARLDERLASRVDESDVLQDVFLTADRRIHDFDPAKTPFFVWLRSLTGQRMVELYRFHVTAGKRTTTREAPDKKNPPDTSTASLADFLASQLTSVSNAVMRAELVDQVRQALDELDDLDREVISMRHYEQMSNEEVAVELGINASTVSTRHHRALIRLKALLVKNPALAAYLE